MSGRRRELMHVRARYQINLILSRDDESIGCRVPLYAIESQRKEENVIGLVEDNDAAARSISGLEFCTV